MPWGMHRGYTRLRVSTMVMVRVRFEVRLSARIRTKVGVRLRAPIDEPFLDLWRVSCVQGHLDTGILPTALAMRQLSIAREWSMKARGAGLVYQRTGL